MTTPTHSLVKALRSVPDFSGLDDHTLLQIAGASLNLFWSAGSTVFEPGSPSEALYIVLSGEVRIVDPKANGDVEVSRVGPGRSFGELSLLLALKHSKRAEAAEDAELLVLPRESFEEVLADNPELAQQFQRRIEERRPVAGEMSDSQ
ncbi:MAG TPA: cyclic nucleotide-binding domain-containing protein [Actinomycetota bacterium]|nr:cyclic nucleotide-binding domain-containing protein [Actinomycetota bacterium]